MTDRFLKTTLFLFLAFFHSASWAGADNDHTLTLREDKIIYEESGRRTAYQIDAVPGLKLITYEKKSLLENHQATDVSEVVVENLNGVRFTLAQRTPLPVSRSFTGSGTVWTPTED